MTKIIIAASLMFAVAACGNDEPADEMPLDQQPQQQEGQQMPMPEMETDVEVSDQELENFLEAAMLAQQVQMGYQQDMQNILEEEDIDMETFRQISQSMQMGQSPEEMDFSQEDIDKYERADASINELMDQMEAELEESFVDEGLDMDMNRFEEINLAVEQDPQLQQKLQQMMQEQMPQQPQQPPQQPQQPPENP